MERFCGVASAVLKKSFVWYCLSFKISLSSCNSAAIFLDRSFSFCCTHLKNLRPSHAIKLFASIEIVFIRNLSLATWLSNIQTAREETHQSHAKFSANPYPNTVSGSSLILPVALNRSTVLGAKTRELHCCRPKLNHAVTYDVDYLMGYSKDIWWRNQF